MTPAVQRSDPARLRHAAAGSALCILGQPALSPGWLCGVLFLLPLLEEWAFRGVLFSRLRFFGDRFALVAAATLFAAAHRAPQRFPLAFFTGLSLGFAALQTGSLRLGAALHIAYNTLVLLWEAGALPVDLAAAPLLLGGMWALWKSRDAFPAKSAPARDYAVFFTAPAMWALWLFLLGGLLL